MPHGGGLLWLEEGEGQTAQDREVLGGGARGVADAHAALLLAEGQVAQPVDLMLDAPPHWARTASPKG